jgi:glyoxylase-like metal-dependent hydrolase (beta-lactamase superfamily II)
MEVQKILAPNPSVFTGPGTNTYLLDSAGEVLIVDPGPIIKSHELAILEAVDDRAVKGVLVTHTHIDHAPLANPVAIELGIPSYGYTQSAEFVPDVRLQESDSLSFGADTLEVLHTPGHSADHLCFLVGRELFTGDHIMGGSTVMIEDLASYLKHLMRLKDVPLSRLFPGHGPEIGEPYQIIDQYISHRLEREQQVIAAVAAGAGTIGAVVEDVYIDIDPGLYPLAAYSVVAHVTKLRDEGVVAHVEVEELWDGVVSLIV